MIDSVLSLAGCKVLVTGGSGFVGSYFVDALLKAGAHVRVTQHRQALAVSDSRIEMVLADLADPADCLRATEGIDAVVHAAGRVGASGVGPQDELSGMGYNLYMLSNVLSAAWKNGVRHALVFGSSTAYPPAAYPITEDELWRESPHPSYLGYGWMRRYVEKLAEFVSTRSGMRIIIVRPSAIYGPRDNFDPATSHVISGLIRRAVQGDNPFVVWGTGDEVRDILHVEDFVAGSLLALSKGRSCDPINIGSGVATTVHELARLVLDAAQHHADIQFDPSRPVAIPYRVLSIDKACRELGFFPRRNLIEGLAETIRWFREKSV
jgi:GDP-L-fucose synthase